MIVRRLDRYVAAQFLGCWVTAFAGVVGLTLLVSTAGKVDEIIEAGPALGLDGADLAALAGRWLLAQVPRVFLQTAPFIGVLAVVGTGLRLVRAGEYVPALMSGISWRRLMAPVVVLCAATAALMIGVRDVAGDRLSEETLSLEALLFDHSEEPEIRDLWLRHPPEVVLRFASYFPQRRMAEGLEGVRRDEDGVRDLAATRAAFRRDGQGGWLLDLTGGRMGLRRPDGEVVDLRIESLRGFEPRDALLAHRLRSDPLLLGTADIRRLGLNNPGDLRLTAQRHFLMTFPLSALLLPLLALPLVLRTSGRPGAEAVLAALLGGCVYFAADFVLRDLASRGTLDPMTACWAPLVVAASGVAALWTGDGPWGGGGGRRYTLPAPGGKEASA